MYQNSCDRWSAVLLIVTQQMRDDIFKKWDSSGMLEGFTDEMKNNVFTLYKNQQSWEKN